MYEGVDRSVSPSCQAIVICMHCIEQGDFDMWTDKAEWNSNNPLVPYDKLPFYNHDDPNKDDPTKYPTPAELLNGPTEHEQKN